jgi:hypothetical protein
MSKDTKDQDPEIKVNDRRRFSMDDKGNVKDTKDDKGEATEQGEQEPPVTEEPKDEKRPELDNCECDDEIKDLPPMTFTTLIFSLSTQAMMSLGEVPDPVTNAVQKNIALAKQSIDLLGILEEKTKGNLTPDEENFIKTSLTDLRLRFVNVCKCSS